MIRPIIDTIILRRHIQMRNQPIKHDEIFITDRRRIGGAEGVSSDGFEWSPVREVGPAFDAAVLEFGGADVSA